MDLQDKSLEYKISNVVFQNIIKEFKNMILDNKNNIEKLKKIDYKHYKKEVQIEEFIEIIDFFKGSKVTEEKTNMIRTTDIIEEKENEYFSHTSYCNTGYLEERVFEEALPKNYLDTPHVTQEQLSAF